MKKNIYIVSILLVTALLFILKPNEVKESSAYQKSDSHLLLPQKNVVIVALKLKDNLLNLSEMQTINSLKILNDKFKTIVGVNRVDSILNASVISSRNDDIEVEPFISAEPTKVELNTLKDKINNYPELKPYINESGEALLFYISFGYSITPTSILNSLKQIEDISPLEFSYTGKSPILAITEDLLSKDILVLLPILFILVMLIFILFKSIRAIAAAWIIIILSVTCSYSFIRFLGIEISPLILLVPVFALGLLSDYIVHYIYHLFYGPHRSDSFKIRRNLLYPLGLTALSTLTGFLSLIYINASGHVLLGSLIAVSVFLTFIGVMLWLPYLSFNIPQKEILPRFSLYQTKLFKQLYNFRKYLFILLIIGVIWGIVKLPGLRTEPYPIEQLPSDSTIKKAENIINNSFYGSLPFFIEIDTGEAGSFLEKDTLILLEELHKDLDNSNEIGYSYSLLTVLKRINYYFMGDEESLIQSTEFDDFYSSLIEQFLLYYSSGVDPLEYESLVDPSYRFFSVKGYMKYDNVESLNNFYDTINIVEQKLPDSWDLNVHGVISGLEKEKNGLTKNWIFSFSLGSFLIFITVLLFYRKLKLALLSLIPGFISMILSFGIISSMGVTIDSFSIIFVAIITGLVIDYSIHTLSALDKMPLVNSIEEGFSYINSYSGIPIFLSFLTSLLSFSVLFLSSFKGARNLGILLFASLIISYILSFYLLPIFILPTKIKKEHKS